MTDNSDKLDFALIRFLLTLVQTQSMQQTANLLNLSQSGASRKLAKASEIFGTELFIRSGFRMIPSAKMNELHPKLEVLLKQHESLFASTNAFKPLPWIAFSILPPWIMASWRFLVRPSVPYYAKRPTFKLILLSLKALLGHNYDMVKSTFWPIPMPTFPRTVIRCRSINVIMP